jgi:hypothetical protein
MRKAILEAIKAKPWNTVFNAGDTDPVDPPADDAPPADAPPADPGKGKTFTQEQMNAILAEDRRKHKTQQQKTLDELNALKAQTDIGGANAAEYEAKLEELQNSLLTNEQLAKREKDKMDKRHEKELGELKENYDKLNKKYTSETIIRAITDASVTNKAFSPEQIVAILGPNTRLAEVLDDSGEKTGLVTPKIKFDDADKDGKPVTLDLTPDEAIKRMKEIDKFANLFQGEGVSGLGGSTRSGGTKQSAAEVARNPAEYIKARKEGKLDL